MVSVREEEAIEDREEVDLTGKVHSTTDNFKLIPYSDIPTEILFSGPDLNNVEKLKSTLQNALLS